MGMGVPGVWSAPGQVDPLTGLASLELMRAVLARALRERDQLPVSVVVTELPNGAHPVDHARRLTMAGAMAEAAFGSALAVGRLGLHRVGVVHGVDPHLPTRVELLARMVEDLPGTVWLEPVAGSPEVADWLLRELCR